MVKPIVTVKDGNVSNVAKLFRNLTNKWKDRKGEVAAEDRVTVDFNGSIDGEEFEGGKAEDFVLAIGQGRMIPGLKKVLSVIKQVKNSLSM